MYTLEVQVKFLTKYLLKKKSTKHYDFYFLLINYTHIRWVSNPRPHLSPKLISGGGAS